MITFYHPFRRCVTHRRKGFEMKAPFNNNLPLQTGDVMVNPINPLNPDSKTIRCCALNLWPSPQLDLTPHTKKAYLYQMKRFFDTTGLCNAEDQYMVDPFRNMYENILHLIISKQYFLIHAPRQRGKTTFLQALAHRLNKEKNYVAVVCSLESAGFTGRHWKEREFRGEWKPIYKDGLNRSLISLFGYLSIRETCPASS